MKSSNVDYNNVLRLKLLSSSLFFTRYFFKKRFGRKFVVNHHHETMCNAIDRVLSGDCKRLLIRMPPRYGKTEIAVKTLMAQGLAINPMAKFIHLSFSSGLAHDNSEEVRDFIQEDDFVKLFPYMKLDKSSTAKQKWYLEDGGGVYATATGGQITGFGAGAVDEEYDEIIDEFITNIESSEQFNGARIIDDPLKPDDADSEAKRERVNDRFENTIRSRTNSRNTPIIVIGQAVHERDLIGYLLETEPEEWELLTLPAIIKDENGKDAPLWEFKHTLEELYKMRSVNEFVFATQYMQDPRPKEGLLFPRDDLNFFDIKDLRLKEADGVIIVGDIADEGNDYLCTPVGYQYGNKIYIVDVIFSTEPIEITQPRVANLIDIHQPDLIMFESNNGGKAYAQKVNELHSHRKKVRWKHTSQNKHTRIIMKSGIIKENFYFRNDDKVTAEYKNYIAQLVTYTKNGKVSHDDAPDATTMLAEQTGSEKKWGW